MLTATWKTTHTKLSPFIKHIKEKIQRMSFPFTCLFCLEETTRSLDLCADCEQYLPWLKQICRYCAMPLIHPSHTVCGRCLTKPFPFHKTCILFSYTSVLQRFITGLKFHGRLLYAEILGQLLAEHLKKRYQGEKWPQVLIPVPLHAQRLRERGFNQCIEIARPIQRSLTIAVDYKSCIRIRPTLAQSGLSASQRIVNLENAFRIKFDREYEHVALLDDVMTTGQTLIELGRLVYQAGVKRIDVWCCARTHLGIS